MTDSAHSAAIRPAGIGGKNSFIRRVAAATALVCALWPPTSVRAQSPIVALLEPDREHIYVGETFELTLAIYSDGPQLADEMELTGMPDASLLVLDTFGKPMAPGTRQLEGRTEIRRHRAKAVAKRAGTYSITPVLKGTLVQRSGGFFPSAIFRTVQIPVQPLTLEIHPVPPPAPGADVSGAIGQIEFAVDVQPTDLVLGDLIKIGMSIRAQATLPELNPPAVVVDRNFKEYPTRRLAEAGDQERRFEKVVIPMNTNATVIPPISFTYFDPRARQYRTVTRGPFPLSFHARKELTRATVILDKPEIRATQPVTLDPALLPAPREWLRSHRPWHRRIDGWLLQAVPILGLALLAALLSRGVGRLAALGAAAGLTGGVMVLWGAILASDTPAKADAPGGPASTFAQAAVDFGAKRYPEAVSAYERIAAAGYDNVEVFHNLANACYENGQIGKAVLNYLRAQERRPRDVSVQDHLSNAEALAGVHPSGSALLARVRSLASLEEWMNGGRVFYWTLCLLGACALASRRSTRALRAALISAALLMTLSFGGAAAWLTPSQRNLAVAVREEKARFGPMIGASTLFSIKEGTSLQILDSYGEWAKIECDRGRGWIDRQSYERVNAAD